ncbi:type I-C CRISPR-associated protein Cas5 [Paenibacillus sp. IB182496]|uniref:pre-crRNA processing endonuclease n=1 Tax=Paenibacillus sabuli TaxID=2772509 RepID=A0A927BTA2_9BACL|nr:type I-C CRISPR-associated protein Cas5c [Paenibacillus sabuli]MBD2846387.1 type I-C CRISPR-associated protein Cas5 [Paenibacillus sabuli]
MGYGIKLHVCGDYACFTRPEMKVERVSYDVMTPSAARGLLEAIHWKPAIRWVVGRIHVLNEIRFENVRRNEIENKISTSAIKNAMNGKTATLAQVVTEERQQRATLMLKAPAYLIEAHFDMTAAAGSEDSPEKHYNIFLRRARQGQCFHRPYLGCREFAAHFKLIEPDEEMPVSFYSDKPDKDLGWMLHDIDFMNNMTPKFFRAEMRQGIVRVPPFAEGV